MRFVFISILLGLSSYSAASKKPMDPAVFERQWTTFLSQHVDENGRVDYKAIQANPTELNAIYHQIELSSPDAHPQAFPTENERFAYWINAYNIAAMKAVVDNYPIGSVHDVSGLSIYAFFDGGVFFAGIKHKFGGKKWNLYKLEQKLIRKRFHDPRLHFALNCASIGCPELPQEAFQAAKLDQQLDTETRDFMNDKRKFRIDEQKKEIQVSSLFDWYKKDFLKPKTDASDILDYIEPYLNETSQAALREARQKGFAVAFIEYDWGLNDQARQ